jgi:hypothetical protein
LDGWRSAAASGGARFGLPPAAADRTGQDRTGRSRKHLSLIDLSRNVFIELLGVFLAGATPWLEALLVVPAGIAAGLPFGWVLLAALAGNLLTVAVAVWFGEAIRDAWARRKARRGLDAAAAVSPRDPDADADPDASASVRDCAPDALPSTRAPEPASPSRARRVFDRWGLPGLAILGPLGLGTQVSAALAVALGQGRRTTFVWISIATGVWALVAGLLAQGGLQLLGRGG